jgi:hypothetical protein
MPTLALLILTPVFLAGAILWRLYSLEAPQVRLPEAPPSRPGLWYFGHRADRRFPFQHLFIRITPTDPSWAVSRPDLFCRRDGGGRPYCTLGAGPRGGLLFLEFNRAYDLGDPASFEEAIPSRDLGEENARIAALLEAAESYGQGLAFAAWSRISGSGFNCNSMITELGRRAALPGPQFTRHFLLCPGIGKGLPGDAFGGRTGA